MKIILDAGHGPNTAGKRSPNGMKEFEFNAAIAELTCCLLERKTGATILFSHSRQRDVPLKERTDYANRTQADCFISIHANAFGTGWNTAEGIETFVHSSKPREAFALATHLQSELIKVTNLKDRGVKTANFHVLRETAMTAVLLECGFMTNRKEAALLASQEYRQLCAGAIAKAVMAFYPKLSDVTCNN